MKKKFHGGRARTSEQKGKKKTDRQKIIKSIFQIHSYTIHLKKSKQNKRQKPKVTFFPILLFFGTSYHEDHYKRHKKRKATSAWK